MTLLVYCAWETRVMRTNIMLSKKAAIRTMAIFNASSNEEPFEAQVLDCVSIIMNLCKPEVLAQVLNSQIYICEKSGFIKKPCSTSFGREFFQACNRLGLIDPAKMVFGGLCSHQFGGYTQQLHSVDIRRLSADEADSLSKEGFLHLYAQPQFNEDQLAVLLGGGVIRHTFGVFDTEDWRVDETFEVINY